MRVLHFSDVILSAKPPLCDCVTVDSPLPLHSAPLSTQRTPHSSSSNMRCGCRDRRWKWGKDEVQLLALLVVESITRPVNCIWHFGTDACSVSLETTVA